MPNPTQVYRVSDTILNDPSNEEGSIALDYYLNACAYLLNVLNANPKLRRSELAGLLQRVLAFFDMDPSERDNSGAIEQARWLGLFGVVGKALWFLRDKENPQLRRELKRLATEPLQIVGNQYLFYVAGTLAAKGYDIEFAKEQRKRKIKTPDLRASKAGKSTWIEANTKSPTIAADTPQRLAWMARDIIAEKKTKFSDPAYCPGLIVADISPANFLVNETGTFPHMKLDQKIVAPLPNGGSVCRLYDDPGWSACPENSGNVVRYVLDEFSQIDRSKYHVFQCLITVARRAYVSTSGIAFPKFHLLLVDRSAEQDALFDLARWIYVV
jgi:hypothetical protein